MWRGNSDDAKRKVSSGRMTEKAGYSSSMRVGTCEPENGWHSTAN